MVCLKQNNMSRTSQDTCCLCSWEMDMGRRWGHPPRLQYEAGGLWPQKQRAPSNQINLCFHEPHERGLHLQSISDYIWTWCNIQFKHQRAVKRWKLGIWVCMMEISVVTKTGWVKGGYSSELGGLNRTPVCLSGLPFLCMSVCLTGCGCVSECNNLEKLCRHIVMHDF